MDVEDKSNFKVVMVALDPQAGEDGIPGWVQDAFRAENVDFVYEECATRDDMARVAGDADLVWVLGGSEIVNAETLPVLKRCGAVIRTGSGTDNVDVEAATRQGIVVTNTPGAHDDEVSEHAIALLLSLVRVIPLKDRELRQGIWGRDPLPNHHVFGQTLGLVGFGRIAQLVARKMSGFDMTVLCNDPYVTAEVMSAKGAQHVSLDEIWTRSDFVSLHCPLTASTKGLVGERELRMMKPEALLINTSRGPVVQESALTQALRKGWIAGAGLDVFEEEPTPADNPLLTMDNVVFTPHTAGHSDLTQEKQWRLSVESAIAFSNGHWPESYVNHDVEPRWKLS
jgi:D-3-phosphoglycerate dehydrogenase